MTEILAENRDVIAAQAGQEIELKYVLDLREFPDSPIADKVIHELSSLKRIRRFRSWWKPWEV